MSLLYTRIPNVKSFLKTLDLQEFWGIIEEIIGETYMEKIPVLSDKCVICGCLCERLYSDTEKENTENCTRKNGGIISLHFGYGSTLDTSYFNGVICDACAKTLIETAAEPFGHHSSFGNSQMKNVEELPED